MYLETIKLSNFKNIAEAQICCCAKINCITGANGSGKTTLLDAIHYLSMTKSYFGASDIHSYKYGESAATIFGRYINEDNTTEQISVSLRKGEEKQVKRGQKVYKKLSEHIGLIPIVMTSSYDLALINDSSEERRKFINTILSQTDKEYLRNLQYYNQLLTYRNKLLKEDSLNVDFLDTINYKMIGYANYIYEKRGELASQLSELALKYYNIISDGKESVAIKYISDLHESSLEDLMVNNIDKDHALGFTSCGIHRDDLKFYLSDHAIKHCGSQGQQKTFTLSLKLAQFELMRTIYGFPPLLLLDDVFDKLDSERVTKIVSLVSQPQYGQIFITDGNNLRLADIVKQIVPDAAFFVAENGNYNKI